MMILSLCLATCLPFFVHSLTFSDGESFNDWHNNFLKPKLTAALHPPMLSLPLVPFIPFHQERQTKALRSGIEKKSSPVMTGSRNPRAAGQQFSWTSTNYESRRIVKKDEDYYLETEVNAPSGSQLIWYKNDAPFQTQSGGSMEEGSLEIPSSSSSLLRIASGIFIDCAQAQDSGVYRLEVRNPHDRLSLVRNFTVIVVDWYGAESQTCRAANVMRYVPRIYQRAIYARAHEGATIILPCRYQGTYVSRAWYKNFTRISDQDPSYEILSNGDLVIKSLSANAGPVQYACRVASTLYVIDPDIAFTAVYTESNAIANN